MEGDERRGPDESGQKSEDDLEEQAHLLDDAVSSRSARKGLIADIALKGGGVYSVVPPLFAERVARIHSPLLTAHGGDPSVVARYLQALAGLVKSIDPNIVMHGLKFIASVDITLSPEIEPDVKRFALDQAERNPDRRISKKDLPLVVPPPVLSLEAAAYLLSLDEEVITDRATAVGTGPREALRSLSKRLAADGGSIELLGPAPVIRGDGRPIVVVRRQAGAVCRGASGASAAPCDNDHCLRTPDRDKRRDERVSGDSRPAKATGGTPWPSPCRGGTVHVTCRRSSTFARIVGLKREGDSARGVGGRRGPAPDSD
jgi:hypothetical protein